MSYVTKSIRETCCSDEAILRRIYAKMMQTRQPDTVRYRPMTLNEYVNIIHKPGVDFAQVFSNFNNGDYAFITCDAEGVFEWKMLYNIYEASPCELFCNGEKKKLQVRSDGSFESPILLHKGQNRIVIKVTAQNGVFRAYVRMLLPGLRMGAGGYVYNLNTYITTKGFYGQEGLAFSRKYDKNEPEPKAELEAIDWIFPVCPSQSDEKTFNFHTLCGRGSAAYVYTCFCGEICVKHESPLAVFADGRCVYRAESGSFTGTFERETALLFKSGYTEKNWGFTAHSKGVHTLPFAETDDCDDLHWIWVGPFGRLTDSFLHPYAPEVQLVFHKPFPSVSAGEVYWQFYRPNTYLKQYLLTTFYGQWFYAMMVGHHGLHQLADSLSLGEIYDYFMGSMKTLCDHQAYGKYDRETFGWSTYLPGSGVLDSLDPIGTIGMNIAEYYCMSGDDQAHYMLSMLSDAILHDVPRFEDGTYHRIKTMWTDDMYMCLPFLVRLGVVFNDTKYYDEIITQVEGFYKRMFMADKKLYSHIYFPEEKAINGVPWGRGNGWVLLALSEVLLFMPKSYKGYARVLEIYREFAKGILDCRDQSAGIWHQVLDRPQSYIETSGSAMFITALARGVTEGWLSEIYSVAVTEAWEALTEQCVDADGNVYGVCMGSGCHKETEYYEKLGTIVNDDHGIGVVLGAGAAVMAMKKKAAKQSL